MQTYYCKEGCCQIKIKSYKYKKMYFNRHYRKAGVFIYDPKESRVLLVQSRGHLWGPPKGSLNIEENSIEGAIREVKEETGLIISSDDFTKFIKIRNNSVYYYLEMLKTDIKVQDNIKDNDANGITWIKIKCLENAIEEGYIILNHYAKIVFWKFMKKTFPKSNWVRIKRS